MIFSFLKNVPASSWLRCFWRWFFSESGMIPMRRPPGFYTFLNLPDGTRKQTPWGKYIMEWKIETYDIKLSVWTVVNVSLVKVDTQVHFFSHETSLLLVHRVLDHTCLCLPPHLCHFWRSPPNPQPTSRICHPFCDTVWMRSLLASLWFLRISSIFKHSFVFLIVLLRKLKVLTT